MMNVSQLAKQFGISVRTLHYYDEIGLVKPSMITDAGYRYYDDNSVSLLQQILFYRELEFSLKEIKQIIFNPDYDKNETLKNHKDLLIIKRNHLNSLIDLVNNTIGGNIMSEIKTSYEDIENAKKKYADEVKQRWGNTSEYNEYSKKDKTTQQELDQAKQADEIFAAFSENIGKDPADKEVQALVEKWRKHISENYYECSKQILADLGEMYVGDERFTQNIDRFGKGTAKLMSDAIKIYCK